MPSLQPLLYAIILLGVCSVISFTLYGAARSRVQVPPVVSQDGLLLKVQFGTQVSYLVAPCTDSATLHAALRRMLHLSPRVQLSLRLKDAVGDIVAIGSDLAALRAYSETGRSFSVLVSLLEASATLIANSTALPHIGIGEDVDKAALDRVLADQPGALRSGWAAHDAPVCAQETRIVVCVKSSVFNFERRDAVRASYGSYEHVRTVFTLGMPATPDDERLQQLHQERQRHGDVILSEAIDARFNLTLRLITALSWSAHKCSAATFVVLTDDDVFINARVLHQWLATRPTRDLYAGSPAGGPVTRPTTVRDAQSFERKYDVPFDVFANETYGTYISGAFVVLSRDAVALVLAELPALVQERMTLSIEMEKLTEAAWTDMSEQYGVARGDWEALDNLPNVTLPRALRVTGFGKLTYEQAWLNLVHNDDALLGVMARRAGLSIDSSAHHRVWLSSTTCWIDPDTLCAHPLSASCMRALWSAQQVAVRSGALCLASSGPPQRCLLGDHMGGLVRYVQMQWGTDVGHWLQRRDGQLQAFDARSSTSDAACLGVDRRADEQRLHLRLVRCNSSAEDDTGVISLQVELGGAWSSRVLPRRRVQGPRTLPPPASLLSPLGGLRIDYSDATHCLAVSGEDSALVVDECARAEQVAALQLIDEPTCSFRLNRDADCATGDCKDLAAKHSSSSADCCRQCSWRERCTLAVFFENTCYMKSGATVTTQAAHGRILVMRPGASD